MSSMVTSVDVSSAAALGQPAGVLTRVEPRRGWRLVDVRELFAARELLGFLVWRDIQVQYKQTVIGAAWVLAKPVATMLIFTIVFSGFAKVPSGDVPYPLFVFAALLPWTLFSSVLSRSAMSLVSQTHLITKIYFPRLIIPISAAGVDVLNFAVSLLVYVALMIYYAQPPNAMLLLLPVLVFVTLMISLGVGCLLASLTVYWRDVRHALPFLVQAWLFLSPVIYPVEIVPQTWRWLLALNPMTGVITAFRGALYGAPIDLTSVGVSALMGAATMVAGVVIFTRMERRFADVA